MPEFVSVRNPSRPRDQAPRLRLCTSFGSRLRGLMFRSRLSRDDGLILVSSTEDRIGAAVHMLFMRFPIAVIWLDAEKRVVDKVLAQPWRHALLPTAAARYVLEVHPERLDEFSVGDQLEFVSG